MNKLSVGYVRCSTDMQEESPEQQIKELEKWAAENGFKVLRWFIDRGKSGTTFVKRPQFMDLIRAVEHSPNFEYILVYDESRWGRAGNPRENSYWKMHMERFGVKVIIIHSQSKGENDIGSYVVEVVESAEASEYSKKLARATLRGTFSNAQKGFYNGGTAAYGMTRIAVDKATGAVRRVLKPGQRANRAEEKVRLGPGDPLEVEVVKRIFSMRLQGYGYRSIAQALNADQVPCPQRGRWRNANQRWSMVTIKTIIENPTYKGALAYNRFPMTKKRLGEKDILGKVKLSRRSSKEEVVVVEGTHEGLVSIEVWQKVNTVNRPTVQIRNQRFRESPYILSGLIKCSHCGFNFQGTTQTARHQNPAWAPTKIQYYLDGGYHAKGLAVCSPLRIRREFLESFVIDSIREYLATSNIVDKALLKLQEMLEGDEVRSSEKGTISDALDENARKTENLIRLAESGAKVDAVMLRLKQLERERILLQEQISAMEASRPAKADLNMLAEEVRRVVGNFNEEFSTANYAQQKELLRRFVAGVIIQREGKPRAQCYIRKIPLTAQLTGSSVPCVAGEANEADWNIPGMQNDILSSIIMEHLR